MALPRRFRWKDDLRFAWDKTPGQLANKSANNLLIEGVPASGKNYLADGILEEFVDKGKVKVYDVWRESFELLKESLAWMCPSEVKGYQERFGVAPKGYPTLVFVPISDGLPKKLPKFFMPYSIPVDSLGDYGLMALSGINAHQRVMQVYKSRIKKKSSVTDLKMMKTEGRGKHRTKGFGGREWLSIEENYADKTSFKYKFRSFVHEGILSSGGFEYGLENQLKRQLNVQQVRATFYFGFIDNYFLRRFCMIHAVETLKKMLSELAEQDFRNVLLFNEFQDLSEPDTSKASEEIDKVVNRFLKHLLFKGRHSNITIVADCKPNTLDDKLKSNFQFQYLTRFTYPQDVAKRLAGTENRAQDVFSMLNERSYVREHGFVDTQGNMVAEWFDRKTKTHKKGFRLMRAKRSRDGSVRVMPYNWSSFLFRENGEAWFSEIDMGEFKQALVEDWARTEDEALSKADDKAQKEQEEANRPKQAELKQMRIDYCESFLQDQLDLMGWRYVSKNRKMLVEKLCEDCFKDKPEVSMESRKRQVNRDIKEWWDENIASMEMDD